VTALGGGWAAASASVRGASHERTGKPNQDAVRVVEVDGAGRGGLVAAVCDGHGGDRYIRSDVGSRLGVEVACSVGRRALATLAAAGGPPTEDQVRAVVIPALIERWRRRVMDDVDARPFTSEERERAGAELDGEPLVSYGATLVMAILAPTWIAFVQIGDGDAIVMTGGRAVGPVPHDDRLVGGETTSLCLPTADADARVAVVSGSMPDLVILSSDGYANSFASPTWRDDVGRDLLDLVGRRGIDDVEAQLPAWLADSAAAAGDDVSMALVHRTPAPAGAPPPSRTVAAEPVAVGASEPEVRRRSPVRAVVLAGVVALLGLAAGVAIGRSTGDAGEGQASASDATSTMATTTPTITAAVTSTTTAEQAPVVPDDAPLASTPQTSAAAELTMTSDDRVLFFAGANGGVVLVLEPDDAEAPNARLIRWVESEEPLPVALPDGWTFEDGKLSFDDSPIAQVFAVAWPEDSPYVWAVAPDRRTLTPYDRELDRDDRNEAANSTAIVDDEGNELPAFEATDTEPTTTTSASTDRDRTETIPTGED
jgi:hypothetical protein